MGRKTRWSTRIIILVVISCVLYTGTHVYYAIKQCRIQAQRQPVYINYSENR